jgi:hypothetical protein
MQLALLGVALDGAAKTHAAFILLLAAGLAVELAVVVGVPVHE